MDHIDLEPDLIQSKKTTTTTVDRCQKISSCILTAMVLQSLQSSNHNKRKK